MHHDALRLVPNRVGRDVEGCHRGIEEWVRRLDHHLVAQDGEMRFRLGEHGRQLVHGVSRAQGGPGRRTLDPGAIGRDLAVRVQLIRGRIAAGHALQSEEEWCSGRQWGVPDHDRQRRRQAGRGQQVRA